MSPVLGLRANVRQFALLVAVSALVGGMIGQERTVLPLLATDVFGLTGFVSALTFVVAFGIAKAFTNLAAGALADRFGRKPVLVAGWLIGLPVPLLIILAPSWGWIVAANLLLGVNQGLTWSTTVIMKIDLVGPVRRGLATGINEAAGYGARRLHGARRPAGSQPSTASDRGHSSRAGLCAARPRGVGPLRPRDARPRRARAADASIAAEPRRWREVFWRTTLRDRNLSAASQAGLVNNLNDGMAWGLLPLFYARRAFHSARSASSPRPIPRSGRSAQVVTGALSDRTGRKPLIVGGMLLQAGAIAVIAVGSTFTVWLLASAVLGLGTAMVYPTLLAAVADVAGPAWRGSAIGVYRLWRDLGFAIGALVAGVIADALGMPLAIGAVAVLTAASGLIVLARMRETLVR